MSGDTFTLTGSLSGGTALAFQAGFTREVETADWFTHLAGVFPFVLMAAGPVLFQTLYLPSSAETLEIAEDPNPGPIATWCAGGVSTPPQKVSSYTLQTTLFKQFIPVNGPFIGMRIVGASSLLVMPKGLIDRGPSSIQRASSGIPVAGGA